MKTKELSVENRILLDILAMTDSIWLPDRRPLADKRHTLIFELRSAYFASGVTIANLGGGGSDAARKQSSRALQALVDKKMVTVHRPKWARALAAKTTLRGDTFSRALAGLPIYCHDDLINLARLADSVGMECSGLVYGPGGAETIILTWIPELDLCGIVGKNDPNHKGKRADLALRLLPCIIQGLVVSGVNVEGVVSYSLAPSGRAAVQKGPESLSEELPEVSDAAVDYYIAAVEAAMNKLETQPPLRPNEIGEIPLPVSWPAVR